MIWIFNGDGFCGNFNSKKKCMSTCAHMQTSDFFFHSHIVNDGITIDKWAPITKLTLWKSFCYNVVIHTHRMPYYTFKLYKPANAAAKKKQHTFLTLKSAFKSTI